MTEGVTTGVGLVLFLAAVLGFMGALDHLLSIDERTAPDNFLHLVTGVATIGFGMTKIAQDDIAEVG